MNRSHVSATLTDILFASALTLVLLLGAAGSSAAAGLLQGVSPADARTAAGQGPSFGILTTRSRVVRINAAELSRHIAPRGADNAPDRVNRANRLDGIIQIELFPDAVATFRRTNVEAAGDSGLAWTGQVDGNPLYFASLIVENGEVTGHIQLLHQLFRIDPAGNGLHRVTELDSSKFGKELVVPYKGPRTAAPEGRSVDTRAKTVITVLIAYTAAARAQDANIKQTIKQAVALANTAYANTRIPITLQIADIVPAGSYVETGGANGTAAFSQDLNNVSGNNGATLSKLRNLRKQLGADLVSLFRVPPADNICGIAWESDFPSSATKDAAYSVMSRTCVSNLSFHHEAGHNMGLRHDWFVDPNLGANYNHGYVNKAAACRIRTIMGYNNDCSSSGFNCTRINVFSTPNFTVKIGGTSCQIGVAGGLNPADNTRRLIENRKIISKYRNPPAPDVPGAPMADAR